MNPYREKFDTANSMLRNAEGRVAAVCEFKEKLQVLRRSTRPKSLENMKLKWQIEDVSKEIKKIREEIADLERVRKTIMKQYDAYEENPIELGVDERPLQKDPNITGSRSAAFENWSDIREKLN